MTMQTEPQAAIFPGNTLKIFIGSSSQEDSLKIAEALKHAFEPLGEVRIWTDGVFKAGADNIKNLIDQAGKTDFAFLVFGKDDPIKQTGRKSHNGDGYLVRDNVVFELGLFMGIIGKDRTFFVYDAAAKPHILSDLEGIAAVTFDSRDLTSQKSFDQVVAEGCKSVAAQMLHLGSLCGIIPELTSKLRDASGASQHPAFKRRLTLRVGELLGEADEFCRGKVTAKETFGSLLSDVYAAATSEIFSTSVPTVRPLWERPVGQSLLKVQAENAAARSRRVFVYDKQEDVDQADISVFKSHEKHHVEVLLFFDAESPMAFPPTIENDWTLIDDGAVIVTSKHQDHNRTEIDVFFGDEEKGSIYRNYAENLLLHSRPWKEIFPE